MHAKAKPVQDGILDNQEERQSIQGLVVSEREIEDHSSHAAFPTKGEMILNSLSGLKVTKEKLGLDDHLRGSFKTTQANEALDTGELVRLTNKKITTDYIGSDSNQDNSASILEKLFGSTLTVNTSSNFIEVISVFSAFLVKPLLFSFLLI